jgi:tRNA-Thr(GGU) m(6)t(6)A37 methyltransferase TsaA
MSDDAVTYEPIGVIRTPYDSPEGMPIQPVGGNALGTVELAETHAAGLADLDGFSHCILLYHFHESDGPAAAAVEPFLDEVERGLFATRAPRRPNPLGLSVVAIEDVADATLSVRGIDVVDGTPLLDVKPFVPDFDVPEEAEAGWLDDPATDPERRRADDRFC